MAYEHKEGNGTLFPNDYKLQDTHPDFRGTAKWRGEMIEIKMWKGETQSGTEKFSLQIKEPRKKGEAKPQAEPDPKYTPKEEDDIPF